MKPPDNLHIPFGPIEGVDTVKYHAIRRYMERISDSRSVGEVIVALERFVSKAATAKLKDEKVFSKLLSHGNTATYKMLGEGKGAWVLVIVGSVLVTIHDNAAREFTLSGPRLRKLYK